MMMMRTTCLMALTVLVMTACDGDKSLPKKDPHLGQLGYPCDAQLCQDDLTCRNGVCEAAGAAYEPCRADGSCDAGLTCMDNLCKPLGGLNETCLPGAICNGELDCVGDRCIQAGGLNQPCLTGALCDTGYACYYGTCVEGGEENETCFPDDSCAGELACNLQTHLCVPSLMMRFCHCLASGGQAVTLFFTVAEIQYPGVRTQNCSPCQKIPTGLLQWRLDWDDGVEVYHGATDVLPSWPAEVTAFGTLGGVEWVVYGCDEQMPCL